MWRCLNRWCAMPPSLKNKQRRHREAASRRSDIFFAGYFAMPSTLYPNNRFHVAIIMDGNGRWATARGLSRTQGHRAGVKTARTIVEAAPGFGISILTLFAFSSDNWQRPADEVAALMWLLRGYLRADISRLLREDTRLVVLGRRDRIPNGL